MHYLILKFSVLTQVDRVCAVILMDILGFCYSFFTDSFRHLLGDLTVQHSCYCSFSVKGVRSCCSIACDVGLAACLVLFFHQPHL